MVDLSQLQKVKTEADLAAEAKSDEAIQYLRSTDWYVIRQVETGKAVPEEVQAARRSAREQLA